ncbi:MAG: T9SS type A sorting domain-containing protein [Calditrichales bacterium]|nr:MAG: T9SS type A sorting domain-containing protein [Calditrichales bacterium]
MKNGSLSVLFMFIIVCSTVQPSFSNESAKVDRSSNHLSIAEVNKNLASMPLVFTKNQGQWDDKVMFRSNVGGATMWFAKSGAYYQFTRSINSEDVSGGDRQPKSIETMMIKARFVGSNQNPAMQGIDKIDYKCNYFIGNDKSKWATDVPNYQVVMYKEIYDGIDLKYYGNGIQMEYDFLVSPGADFSQIKIQYEGAESININDNGELVVTTIWGDVIEQRPLIYQVENDSRIALDGKYLIQEDQSFSFELSGYDPSLPLVIDPILSYSTYFGGTGQDNCFAITVNDSGSAYITGYVRSTDFPTTAGAYQDSLVGAGANFDAFVTKLNPEGSALVFSTYIGGDKTDAGYGINVDSIGDVYVSGETWATDFPTTVGAYQTALNGIDYDAFVIKLNSSGNSLIFSTLLGGTGKDECHDISIDGDGNSYICGTTESSNFPTTAGVIQETFIGGGFYAKNDAYVAKFNPTATALIYSTYLGGNNIERAWGIETDNHGNAFITGYTQSTDFPTTAGAFQTTLNGTKSDAYIIKLNPSGTALIYGSYLGGIGSETANNLTLDTSGNAYIAGFTNGSADFPTTAGAYKTTYEGNVDAFVTKFNSTGDSLVFSTYLGGTNSDYIRDIALDKFDNVYIAGHTASADFPTTVGAFQTTNTGGPYDGFMSKLNYLGNALDYSTYMGGASASESMSGIALDSSGNVYFAGNTSSPSFPTTAGAYKETYQGSSGDAFIVKFSDFLTDTKEYDIENVLSDFKMSQNYPNPFNPTTNIEFSIQRSEFVTLKVYNLLGQEVATLVSEKLKAGNYTYNWNAGPFASGVYYYKIEAGNLVQTRKMVYLK